MITRWLKYVGLCVLLATVYLVGWLQAGTSPSVGDEPACQSLEEQSTPFVVTSNGTRCIKPFAIPVPDTISPEAQAFLIDEETNSPLGFGLPDPDSKLAWKLFSEADAARLSQYRDKLLKKYPVTAIDSIVSGVNVTDVIPAEIARENRHRLLINVHGGAFIFGRGDISEAIMVAHHGKIRVRAVDYRMPPEHPFPAALEDILAVYADAMEEFGSERIAIFGSSAGGGLTASAVLKIRDQGFDLPAAVGLLTPSVDFVKEGDSMYTNQFVDKILPTVGDSNSTVTTMYAGNHDLGHPYLSPVYADLSAGFPPAFLLTGTRDLLLSDTVRMHRVIHRAGITTELHVHEAMPHAFQVIDDQLPESREAYRDMMQFFDKHLAGSGAVPTSSSKMESFGA